MKHTFNNIGGWMPFNCAEITILSSPLQFKFQRTQGQLKFPTQSLLFWLYQVIVLFSKLGCKPFSKLGCKPLRQNKSYNFKHFFNNTMKKNMIS